MPGGGAVVELEGAFKSFGSIQALRGVDLAINEGETVAILGPNGAGKTTAISLMLGIRRPTSGRALLFGLPPGDRAARSRTGVMLQESGVPGSLRVREIVDLFRSYYPNPISAERAMAMAGLSEQAGQASVKLSGGQRQRLYYALAVCGDPEVVFLDEPTVGMDVESRRAFLDGIREFRSQGRTIVLTTHYLAEADELAERVVVIDHGRVIADASPLALKARVAGKRIRFHTSRPLSEADFAGLPHTALSISEGEVRLLSSEPEPVLAALFARGVPISQLEVVGADLEEAFLSLTANSAAEVEATS